MKMKDVLKGMSTPKLIATLFESLRDRNVAESREFIKEATTELSNRPPVQGPKGDKGDPGVGAPLINNLETGGTEAALTAEMGKEIKSQLDELAKVISINKFIEPTDTTHTNAFNKAILYAKTNKIELFVPNGEYIIDSTVDILGVPYGFKISFSSGAIVKAKTNDYVFKMSSKWCIIDNLKLQPYDNNFRYKYKGIHIYSSVCNIINPQITNANIALNFNGECFCSRATSVKLLYNNNAIIFGVDSGGCNVTIDHISGTAGYSTQTEDGSIGIQLLGGTSTVSGGQVDSFNYAYSIKSNQNRLHDIYVEKNLKTFKDDSFGEIIYDCHDVDTVNILPNNLIKITQAGYSQRTSYNNSDIKNVIPFNSLSGYYIFDKVEKQKIKDYSGNGNDINVGSLEISDSTNIFGKSVRLSTHSGKMGKMPLSGVDVNKPLTFVFSFKCDKRQESARIIDIRPLGIDKRIYYTYYLADTVFHKPLEGNAEKLSVCRSQDYGNVSSCYSITLDFQNGSIKQQQTIVPNSYIDKVDMSEYISNGLPSEIIFLNNFQTLEWYDFNYIYIFNCDISREQLMAIQSQKTFLTTPKYLSSLSDPQLNA